MFAFFQCMSTKHSIEDTMNVLSLFTLFVPPHTFENQLLKPCWNMSNCSGEQSSTNGVGFRKSNEPMTVELVKLW